jgi:hypothetical protein
MKTQKSWRRATERSIGPLNEAIHHESRKSMNEHFLQCRLLRKFLFIFLSNAVVIYFSLPAVVAQERQTPQDVSQAACDASKRGAQRYNATDDRMEYCSSTGWRDFGRHIEEVEKYKEVEKAAKEERIEKAIQENQTGTDPRDFSLKWMPYYRYTKLENGLTQQDLTAFGTVTLLPSTWYVL